MVDYKELFLTLCEKIAKDDSEHDNIREELFKRMLESDATPQEQIEYVTAIYPKKRRYPIR